jgi:hypothetical protein
MVSNGSHFLIKFATTPSHVCRDYQLRIAWFVITRPSGNIDVSFERGW